MILEFSHSERIYASPFPFHIKANWMILNCCGISQNKKVWCDESILIERRNTLWFSIESIKQKLVGKMLFSLLSRLSCLSWWPVIIERRFFCFCRKLVDDFRRHTVLSWRLWSTCRQWRMNSELKFKIWFDFFDCFFLISNGSMCFFN